MNTLNISRERMIHILSRMAKDLKEESDHPDVVPSGRLVLKGRAQGILMAIGIINHDERLKYCVEEDQQEVGVPANVHMQAGVEMAERLLQE